jgi:hypothetical protein
MTVLKTFEGDLGEDRNRRRAVRKASPMWRTIYHELRRWAKISRSTATAYKKTEITLETDRVWIIRRSRARRGWCADCGREVDMVQLKDAEALTGEDIQRTTAQPMLPGCGDSRGWHWSKAEDGTPLICLDSLLRSK